MNREPGQSTALKKKGKHIFFQTFIVKGFIVVFGGTHGVTHVQGWYCFLASKIMLLEDDMDPIPSSRSFRNVPDAVVVSPKNGWHTTKR